VKILLDTQVWLWMLAAPERFCGATRSLLESGEQELYLSAASAWEIAIKHGLGKLTLPGRPAEVVPDLMAETAVLALPVQSSHALRVADLPPHHRDPFDRLLVAQAQLEGLPILTADPQLALYDVEIIRA
jgi:PIN domain nuclease of toxin-antitoxin system